MIVMERKYKILYSIVDSFIKKGTPVSSNSLIEEYDLDVSSATIRNEMSELEKEGYIEKAYKHSGRVPTQLAYKFYINNLEKDSSLVSYTRKKIDQIFNDRDEDINFTINEVIKMINKTTNTIAVVKNEIKDLYIEDLKIYDIKNNSILILCVISNGTVIHEEQKIDIDFQSVEKAFKIITKRLIGSNLNGIKEKTNSILEIIKDEIKNVEFNFRTMVFDLINKLLISNSGHKNNLSESFDLVDRVDNKEELKKIFQLIEENKIWDLIDGSDNNDDELFIDLSKNDLNEISLINKTLNLKDGRKTIAFIGAKNQDYKKLITMIDLLEEKLKD